MPQIPHDIGIDEWHAALLTPIVLMWLLWFYAALRAERHGTGLAVVGLTIALALIGLAHSPMLALYLAQWVAATITGVLYERSHVRGS